MKTDKLIEVITKLIQREVRKEMQTLKVQILTELKRPVQQGNPRVNSLQESTHKEFRKKYQVTSKPKLQYSKNPILNEILANTDPVPKEAGSYLDVFDNEEDIINVPTDQIGRPLSSAIKSGNKGMNAVLEAMNRDYTPLVERMDTKQDIQKSKQDFRQQIMNRMDVMEDDEPDEDFSFLDKVG